MEKIYATVQVEQLPPKDMALPQDVPSQFVAEAVARAMGLRLQSGQSCAMDLLSGGNAQRISPARTLEEARILNGSRLRILLESLSAGLNAVLVSPSGVRFLLNLPENIVGRPADRSQVVQVDLSPLDDNRVVSRRHARIRRDNSGYWLMDESRNGTWVNGKQIFPGEPCPLKDKDEISFGPPGKGVVLTFQTSAL